MQSQSTHTQSTHTQSTHGTDRGQRSLQWKCLCEYPQKKERRALVRRTGRRRSPCAHARVRRRTGMDIDLPGRIASLCLSAGSTRPGCRATHGKNFQSPSLAVPRRKQLRCRPPAASRQRPSTASCSSSARLQRPLIDRSTSRPRRTGLHTGQPAKRLWTIFLWMQRFHSGETFKTFRKLRHPLRPHRVDPDACRLDVPTIPSSALGEISGRVSK